MGAALQRTATDSTELVEATPSCRSAGGSSPRRCEPGATPKRSQKKKSARNNPGALSTKADRALVSPRTRGAGLHVEVHVKLVWMRSKAQSVVLPHLHLNPVVNKVLIEHIPFQQELVIRFERFDRADK
jgi:hypothetical protein